MEFKLGDLVATDAWTPEGYKTCLGMLVYRRDDLYWKVDWYGCYVKTPWYLPYELKPMREKYLELRGNL
jgi:hypothetical protein